MNSCSHHVINLNILFTWHSTN